MINVKLKIVTSNDIGRQGVLFFNDKPFLNTIERPWVNSLECYAGGQPFVSCVPPGEYHCEKVESTRFGEIFVLINPFLGVYKDKIQGREGRFRCYIGHKANYPKDVQGCIGLGLKWWPDEVAVQESKKAVKLFKQTFENIDEFKLTIGE